MSFSMITLHLIIFYQMEGLIFILILKTYPLHLKTILSMVLDLLYMYMVMNLVKIILLDVILLML